MTKPNRWTLTPAQFRWFALADFVSMILIIATGAAVRLTGSGLGCPDWPTCHRSQLVGKLSYNSIIEYGNRMITGMLIIVTFGVLVAAIRRAPRRADLVWLSSALVAGVFGEAILGALVVYFKLNPWLVCLHMLFSLLLVVVGATLYHRSKYLYGRGTTSLVRDPHFLRVARLMWVPLVAVVLAGTVATGSGPHAGGSSGQIIARRIPIGFSSAVWIHSIAATILVALAGGLLLAIWRTPAPLPLQLGVRRLCVIGLVQSAIGFSQYWLHVPVLLVELHVLGAISMTIAVTQFNLRQTSHEREPGTRRAA